MGHPAVRRRLAAMDGRRMEPALFEAACTALRAAAQAACGRHLRAVMVHGSAWKGGFLPHFSDFDCHLYLDAACMEGPLTPTPATAVALQADLGRLDPESFAVSQFQVFSVDVDHLPPEWEPPPPGTYLLLDGELPRWPAAVLTPEQRARHRLAGASRFAASLLRSFQDKGDGRAAQGVVRTAGTTAKGLLPHAAILHGADPEAVWRWPLSRLLLDPPLPKDLAEAAAAFFTGIDPWWETREDPATVRTLFLRAYALCIRLADEADAG